MSIGGRVNQYPAKLCVDIFHSFEAGFAMQFPVSNNEKYL